MTYYETMYIVHPALEAGRYVYDVMQTASDGIKTRLIEGQLIVTPSVSRS